jgi:hypothetical protein
MDVVMCKQFSFVHLGHVMPWFWPWWVKNWRRGMHMLVKQAAWGTLGAFWAHFSHDWPAGACCGPNMIDFGHSGTGWCVAASRRHSGPFPFWVQFRHDWPAGACCGPNTSDFDNSDKCWCVTGNQDMKVYHCFYPILSFSDCWWLMISWFNIYIWTVNWFTSVLSYIQIQC